MARIGVVAIGRNEGERLRRCLTSLQRTVLPIVYVDSGSADRSVELARSFGADVVELDLAVPFTAARARNEGFSRLLELDPEVEFVQFVDSDCEVASGWSESAVRTMDERSEVVVVCGRRRERFPEASIYNRLCDLEWDTPLGEAQACGGDALIRVRAFNAVGGYRDTLIAGEEPELCVRLRERGGKILRLDAEMTLHDAAMTHWRQWWKRNVRAGHAFAEVAQLHRHSPFGIWKREVRSNWFWGVALLMCPFAFFHLYSKIKRSRLRRGDDLKTAQLYARYCVLSKFPQACGQWTYQWHRLVGRQQRLIEYKEEPTA